ncbi:MAG: ABC transporter substrate-binding protein, partial [Brevundimonas sp.]
MKTPAVILALTALFLTSACGGEPDSPATPMRVRWAAEREAALVLYVNTSLLDPVLEAFSLRYPGIDITLHDMNSTLMAEAVVADAHAGRPGADLVWSSAMDVQIKLINDGYAQVYRSPHRRGMPDGSIWRDQGFGLTAEPIVFAYNRERLPQDLVPQSHADLSRLLEDRPEVFEDRVTMYDAERSGVAL